MIRQAAEQSGTARIENMLQVGFFSRRTTEQLGLEGAQQELENLADRLRAQGMGDEAIQQLQELVRKLMETMRRAVRNFTERELQQQNHNYMEKFRREMLTEKSFYHLTEDEILRQQRLGQLPQIELTVHLLHHLGQLSEQLLEVDPQLSQ